MNKEEFRKTFRDVIWDKKFPVWDLSNQDADDLADAATAALSPLFDEIERLRAAANLAILRLRALCDLADDDRVNRKRRRQLATTTANELSEALAPKEGEGKASEGREAQLMKAALEAETLLTNYLYYERFPKDSDCGQVRNILRDALRPYVGGPATKENGEGVKE